MKPQITSLQNPLVKKALKLQQKAAERKKTGLFVAEGRREVSLALSAGFEDIALLICDELFQPDPSYPIPDDQKFLERITPVSRTVYNKLACRKDAEGVILMGKQKHLTINELKLPAEALLLVLEGIEKPGNLGAIMRTADAAGVDAVILADPVTDMYNPNTIRTSMGCVFPIQTATGSASGIIQWLADTEHWSFGKTPAVFITSLQTQTSYYEADMTGPTALVFGAENTGLTESWRQTFQQHIRIPMAGTIDSLNISVSAAILGFEAVRQRKNKK